MSLRIAFFYDVSYMCVNRVCCENYFIISEYWQMTSNGHGIEKRNANKKNIDIFRASRQSFISHFLKLILQIKI